jgi:Domain of unknown function (DUF222)
MRPDPFSDPGEDGQEPDNCRPPAGPDAEPEQQGLFLCLPAGSLDTDRFTQSGPAADMLPDPVLATIIDTVTGEDGKGLAGLSDDQLIGVIAAVRRLESRTAWYLMAAVGEFTARNTGEGCVEEFAADQLAHELHLTHQSAAAQMDYASTVTGRLPATYAPLHAGTIHPVHMRIIEDETRILSAEDAAKADAVLAEAAGSLTFGKLRSTAHRLVLALDPESAKRRKEAARQDAHVRRFREDSGNAGMVARELRRMRSLPPGSTSSSGPWTCVPPASPARCKNSAFAVTSTCPRNATAAASPPTQTQASAAARALGTQATALVRSKPPAPAPARTETMAAAARPVTADQAAAPLAVRAVTAGQAGARLAVRAPAAQAASPPCRSR